MRENEQNMMINGANADMLYANVATYLLNLSKSMIQNHNKRQRSGKPITWSELDYANKELHHQLDVIISGDMNVTDSTAPKFESVNRHKKKLTESQLHKVIKESVKKVLREGKTVNNKPIDPNFFENDEERKKAFTKHHSRYENRATLVGTPEWLVKTKEGRHELVELLKYYNLSVKEWCNMPYNDRVGLVYDFVHKDDDEINRREQEEWDMKQALADEREAERLGFDSVGDYLQWCEDENERHFEMYGD